MSSPKPKSCFDEATRAIMDADLRKMGRLKISDNEIESEIEASPRPSTSNRVDALREKMLADVREKNKKLEERKRSAEIIEPLVRHRKHGRMSSASTSKSSESMTPDGFSASYVVYRCIFLVMAVFVVPYVISHFR